ncbi:DUF192 domain-containing protein [Tropicimonas marinistellae]|uniref:DUF192 domain-containing protein n=1 Tax=Tropicimonas marinistellae TaxID=1739787 RepID=UPI00099011FE|nr:DUF192 domain-containing protein [Tropicimonas marinistellae]
MGTGYPARRLKSWCVAPAALIAACTSATLALAESACTEDRIDLRGEWGSARFTIEVADDVAERASGLMFRESLPQSAGMLFVYEKPQAVNFWMKNTLIPLDLIFADSKGVVTHVHSDAVPQDLTPIPGGEGVMFVLEINGGLAEAMGIAPGTQMRHSTVGAAAAWPCAD